MKLYKNTCLSESYGSRLSILASRRYMKICEVNIK
jgi:hypothetical protein